MTTTDTAPGASTPLLDGGPVPGATRGTRRRLSPASLTRFAVLVVIGWFFLVPVVRLVWLSFSTDGGTGLGNYRSVLSSSATWKTTENTLVVTVVSTVIATVLGVFLAWLVAYTDIRAKRALVPLIMLPFVLPSYIVTLAWTQAFGSGGFLSQYLPIDVDIFNLGGISVVLGVTRFPIVYLLVVGTLRRIPREIEQAARASGAGRWATFVKVTLPAAMPAVAGGALLAFLTALDDFGVPAFLGIPSNITVLSTSIYQELVGVGAEAFYRAAALSVLLGVIAVLATVGQRFAVRRSRQSESLHIDNTPRVLLGTGQRRTLTTVTWVVLLGISIVPLASMVLSSLTPAVGVKITGGNATLKQYRTLLDGTGGLPDAFVNSVKLAVLTALVCAVVGTLFAYLHVRRPSTLSKIVDSSIALPYALPGIVVALAVIFAWIQPLPGVYPQVYGTWTILLIAYVVRFCFYQVRASSAAIAQLDPSLEEAARASGAGATVTWRRILVPLLTASLGAGMGLIVLTAVSELTVSSLLYSADSRTIGVVIFGFEQAGDNTLSTAASTLLLGVFAVIGALAVVFNHLLHRRMRRT